MRTFIRAGLMVIALTCVAGAASAAPFEPSFPLVIAPAPQPSLQLPRLQPALVTLQPVPQVRSLQVQRPAPAARAARPAS